MIIKKNALIKDNNKRSNVTLKMTSKMVESAWANIGLFLDQLHKEIRGLVKRLKPLH